MNNHRVIKFRVWDATEFRYIEVYGIDPNGKWVHVAQGDQYYLANSPKKIEFVLEQFTGLLDKNGKEIYEGDIVTLGKTYPNWIVSWNNRTASWAIGEYYINTNQDISVRTDALEIIGNIHENPELLK